MAQFFSMKSELCGKSFRLPLRLKLFQATVTACFLYGSGTWTMTAARETKIRSAQRRMLRWMLGSGRRKQPKPDLNESDNSTSSTDEEPEPEDELEEGEMEMETWLDWIRRTTQAAEEHLRKCQIDDWVTAVRRKKWRWAGHLARREDGRWATKMLTWIPEHGKRRRGRPCKRWSDELTAFFCWGPMAAGSWVEVAQSRECWKALEEEFVKRAWHF